MSPLGQSAKLHKNSSKRGMQFQITLSAPHAPCGARLGGHTRRGAQFRIAFPDGAHGPRDICTKTVQV
jgi:hypothetical protein